MLGELAARIRMPQQGHKKRTRACLGSCTYKMPPQVGTHPSCNISHLNDRVEKNKARGRTGRAHNATEVWRGELLRAPSQPIPGFLLDNCIRIASAAAIRLLTKTALAMAATAPIPSLPTAVRWRQQTFSVSLKYIFINSITSTTPLWSPIKRSLLLPRKAALRHRHRHRPC